jgi:septation ring formation regulator EzrA
MFYDFTGKPSLFFKTNKMKATLELAERKRKAVQESLQVIEQANKKIQEIADTYDVKIESIHRVMNIKNYKSDVQNNG